MGIGIQKALCGNWSNFKNNKGTIGEKKVTIPGFYYKVIYDGKNKMIGLILPNASSTLSLSQDVVTIDEIELQTRIEFFPELKDQPILLKDLLYFRFQRFIH